MKCLSAAVIIIALLPAAASAREAISLNGAWDFVKVAKLEYPPPATGWAKMQVPRCLFGSQYERAWLRRAFDAPPLPAGASAKLYFGGVKFNAQVYVNGVRVGENFGGYEPFELDITKQIKPGQANELLVGVYDWTGVFSHQVDLTTDHGDALRSQPKDAILSPIGGKFEDYGIWDDVELRIVPSTCIDDVTVRTSWRSKSVELIVAVRNETDAARGLIVVPSIASKDGTAPAPKLEAVRVGPPPGARQLAAIMAAWPNARPWSPDDPFLYDLTVALTDGGKQVDEWSGRIGFREFWIEGSEFYLNGKHVHLLASSTWPPNGDDGPEVARQWLGWAKQANCLAVRLHTQPWRECWYDAADELGLLIVEEAAVWNDDDVYRIDDQRFWDNYATMLQRMVRRDKNHPALVMWSLENEMYGARLNDRSPAKAQLVELGRKMKQWDPTRPITYESDLDPGGIADVIGLHYPHEYPDFNQWPNTAWWMEQPLAGEIGAGGFLNGAPSWTWKRDKPLYIGEFLWCPTNSPASHTIFFGDQAYTDYRRFSLLGKAEAWKMQIPVYRAYGVSGICPWTMYEGGRFDETNPLFVAQRWAMQPIAAFLREYDSRFYDGDKVTRTMDVFNDSLRDQDLTLKLSLREKDRILIADERRLSMKAGGHSVERWTFVAPKVNQRTEGEVRCEIIVGGKTVSNESKPVSLFPSVRFAVRAEAMLPVFDRPGGETAKRLREQGIAAQAVQRLDELPAGALGIVGAGAFQKAAAGEIVIGARNDASAALWQFVEAGGRLLVLEQDVYPDGLFPAPLSDHSSTMCFAGVSGHPVLNGIQPGDLKFWRGDHVVARNEPLRFAGSIPIVISGGSAGAEQAPLIEFRRGKGILVLSQLRLAEKLTSEPAAAMLLQNLLDYLAAPLPAPRPTVVLAADPAFLQCLDGLGLDYVPFAKADLAEAGRLVHAGSVEPLLANRAKIEPFVNSGGTVLLHRLRPEGLAKLDWLVPGKLALVPNRSPIAKASSDDAMAFVLNEDLYWTGKRASSYWWSPLERANDMAGFVISKAVDGRAARSFPAETMKLDGQAGLQDGEAGLYSQGTVSAEVDFPEDGMYVIAVRARGTDVEGVYPTADIHVGEQLLGTVSLWQAEPETYTVFGQIKKGRHPVRITFTNDAWKPPQDRNLYVKELLVAREADPPGSMKLLTSPPALVQLNIGKGRVIIDEINWDTTQSNSVKAERFAGSLLTALGAQFRFEPAVVIPLVAWQPDANISNFAKTPGAIRMASNGTIRAKVRCEREGDYVFRIIACGTPAEKVYPILELAIDGKKAGGVETRSESWRPFPIQAHLSAGEHELALSFTNDLWRPPEDRNVDIQKVMVVGAK